MEFCERRASRILDELTLSPDAERDMDANYFELANSLQASEYGGDWHYGKRRSLYQDILQQADGLWNSDQSWTFDPSHSGTIAGAGLYPYAPLDSAVIGGGDPGAGTPGHEITMNMTPVDIRGVAVGTADDNTGTLLCGLSVLESKHFTMYNLSTLGVGSLTVYHCLPPEL